MRPETEWPEGREKRLDIGCMSVPAFGTNGTLAAPVRPPCPLADSTHDLTVFKNVPPSVDSQRLQFRAGFFNIFNTASPARNRSR